MKKSWMLYLIFGAVLYLLFLIIEMPASWFAWSLNRYTNNIIHIDTISGSLWHGTGRLVIYSSQTTPNDFGIAEWQINPLWLFIGRVQIHMLTNSTDKKINTAVQFGRNQLQLRDTDMTLPASSIGAFYPPASLISPEGKILLRTENMTLASNGLNGKAEIQWENASSSLSAVQPLGTYRLEITGAAETTTFKLNTMQGILELTGQGQWQASTGQFQFSGAAVPRDEANKLEPFLKLLGEDQGNGKRSLILNGRLPLTGLPGF